MPPKVILKRDGTTEPFVPSKITEAARKALEAAGTPTGDAAEVASQVAGAVVSNLQASEAAGGTPAVEQVQDMVEAELMARSPDAARAFILYRERHARMRASSQGSAKPMARAVAEYTHLAKYAAHRGGRRETFKETADRSRAMHASRFPGLKGQIDAAFDMVDAGLVLPSMRSMQFGGEAVERNNVRMYNCAFTLVDRKRVFGEVLYALLSGCGVGYSVQFQHVAMLPPVKLVDETRVRHHRIGDSIEGWADAVNELARAHFETGEHVEFDYSAIRPRGSAISTGGRAPGHLPLKRALEQVRGVLSAAAWRRLRPIECHDVMCYLARAVLAGGIRRSSLISIFSVDDSEMLYSKAHGNFVPAGARGHDGQPLHPKNDQRQMANNSAAMLRSTTTREQFERVVSVSREWGDPGFYFTSDLDYGCNPCGEIGLHPVLRGAGRPDVDRTLEYFPHDYDGPESDDRARVAEYGWHTGFQFCNLCEVNVAACTSEVRFVEAVAAAATIGTLQASYTRFPYLGPVTEAIVRQDALLGVGITGVMDRPGIGLDPYTLRWGASRATEANATVSEVIGIRSATRVTTVKPSGTASLVLGCVGSGVHPHHAKRYFRRITAGPMEGPARYLQSVNPHMVETKPNGDLSIVFPVEAPDGAVTLDSLSGPEFMEQVFLVYENWVKPGTSPASVGLTHNVSCTIHVADGEWGRVIDKAWANRERVTAMSFMGTFNDHAFPFAPRMAVSTQEDERRWADLVQGYRPVDWSGFAEEQDNTERASEPACAGGSCEV